MIEFKTKQQKYLWIEIVFFASFTAGIVAANLFGQAKLEQTGILSTYFIQQFKYLTISKSDYLIYICGIRIPVVIFLLTFGMTMVYKLIHGGVMAWVGFSLGFVCVGAISNMGIRAIPVLLASVLPHYIFYGLGYAAMVRMQWNHHVAHQKKTMVEWVVLYAIVLVLFLLGILSETYISLELTQKILKKF